MSTVKIPTVSPTELALLLQQARDEKWTDLVLLGPGSWSRAAFDDELPDDLHNRSASRLQQIPDDLAVLLRELLDLESLALNGCRIGDAGAASLASELKQLTNLDLSYNGIGAAGAASLASELKQLTNLNLAGNSIGDAGAASIGDGLPNLGYLNVSNNKLIQDATPFAQLKSLRTLDLSGTGVTDLAPLKESILNKLPVFHGHESNGIKVSDCALTTPPLEIVERGPEAVLNYFQEREVQDVDHLYEAKVLILGEGGAGKTSLLRRLYQVNKPLPT
jgi:internalin A